MWALEDGHVAAWSSGTTATIVFTATDSASYKGVAIAGSGTQFLLYLADFHNGKIDVLTSAFASTTVSGGFADPTIPAGFHPFNIMNLNGNLFVAYALKKTAGDYEVAGPGLGFVNVFNPEMIVIGGGVSAAWEMFAQPAREEVLRRAFRVPAQRCRIVRAELGDDAGLIGAAWLVFGLR